MKINEIHGKDGEKGASLVEFAFVFPVAMLMLFSIIDLSMYFYYQASMTNVVRSTLRYTVTGRYEAKPTGGYYNRKDSAIREAQRSLTPLISMTPPAGDLRFYNPDTGAEYTDNELGGPGARVTVVMRQKIRFMSPFGYLIGMTNTNLSWYTTNYNISVSTTYRSEGYTAKE